MKQQIKNMEKRKMRQFEVEKAQASIIVVIMLVLIGIVAVAVLAAWLIPFIKDSLAGQGLSVNLVLDRENSFVNRDALINGGGSTPVNVSFIKLKMENGNVENSSLYGVYFVFSNGDGSVPFINPNFPDVAEYRMYQFSFTDGFVPTSVEIFPVIIVNGKQKILASVDKMDLIEKDILFDNADKCSPQMSSNDFPPTPIPKNC